MDPSERSSGLPRILVIDDFFGRQVAGGTNRDRVALCEKFGIRDLSSRGAVPTPLLERPCAEAEFFRGQVPDPARPGDSVRNDLETSVRLALEGWRDGKGLRRPWAAVVLDLMFFTGRVTAESDRRSSGMPEGRPVDDSPEGYFGIEILRGLRARDPDLPVMILSSKSRGEVSRTFSELGASGFIERDAVDGPETFRSMLARHGLVPDREILGASRPLLAQLRRARLLAEGGGSVLIRGEPGTGKELLARFIHRSSPRANGPFEARSLASIPRDLAESELFGHAKGAFTGAAVDRAGAFERASGGSLLLDEVGDASPELQAKLLRVLESGSLQRVGSDAVRTVDVRVISATNIDVESRAARGEGFREDLLARLRQAGTVTMPPLRERTDDIGELAEHFVRQAERTHGRAMRRTILPETIELLGRQSWPGNIRELRNCLSQAVYQHPDVEFLAPAHVQGVLATDAAMAREIPVPEGTVGSLRSGFHQVLAAMREFAPDDEPIAQWTGSLPEAQAAWSRFAAGLVLAAIRRTKRATVERPDGEVLIHPAMKLLSGNPRLTATQAADLVKRLLAGGPTGEPVPPIDEPDLCEALEIAQRLRPGGGRKGAE